MRAPRGLTRATVGEHRLAIAVAAEHRFADGDLADLADLADERIMVWGHPGQSAYTDFLLEHCRRAGFEPCHTRNPVQGIPPVTAVIGTDHVAVVPAGARTGRRRAGPGHRTPPADPRTAARDLVTEHDQRGARHTAQERALTPGPLAEVP